MAATSEYSIEKRKLGAVKSYKDETPFTGVFGRTTDESSTACLEPPRPPEGAPNVLFFVLDDVGGDDHDHFIDPE